MRRVFQCLSWLTLFTVGTATLPAGEPVRHVVLVSVDGLPAAYLNDPHVPLTTIRELAKSGVMAEGMTVSNPSVTWPNHTTLVSGVRPLDHGVLFNGVLERGGLGLPVQINSRKDKSELVRVTTLPDILKENGHSVVGINWPCTRNSPSYLVDFPDTPDMMKYTTPSFIEEMIQEGIVPEDIRDSFGKLPPMARDRIWTDAACLALRRHKPTFLLVHLLNVDATHHRYGPGTWAGHTAMAYADSCIRRIVETLDETGLRPNTAIFIVSDHGFASTPKTLNPNVLLKEAGLLTVEGNRVAAATAQTVSEGGIAMLYLTRPDTREQNTKQIVELFGNAEGIAEILSPDRYSELGMPQPDEYPQMADLILVAKEGYVFNNSSTGNEFVVPSTTTLGTHGVLSTDPRMNATFVASGAGIRSDAQLGIMDNTQVAPTIAKLLKVKLESDQSKPLEQILEQTVVQKK